MEKFGNLWKIIEGGGAKLHMIKSITVSEQMVALRAPFVTALRRVTSYPVIQVRIELENGQIGFGETVATPQIAGDSHQQILQELSSIKLQEINPELILQLPILPSSKAALDMALWSMQNNFSSSVKSDVTVPICELNEIPEIMQERIQAGFTAFKVKVAQEPIADLLKRIELIRELAGESAILRIDPNQAWSLDYAISAVQRLSKSSANIEYLEQPLAKEDLAGHQRLAGESAIPLMADESCFSMQQLPGVIEANAFAYLNVKIMKAGGVFPALQLAHQAQEAGLQVSIGSMMEGELGIKAALHVAAKIAPEVTHDLDAAWWLSDSAIRYQAGMVSG